MSYLVGIKKVGETVQFVRSLANRAQQFYMGITHSNSGANAMEIPMELIIKRHPDDKILIKRFMKRWHARNSLWPKDGSFDLVCCEEMEINIKHHKSEDHSDRRLGKRTREREVLNWFKKEGYKRQMTKTERKAQSEENEKN